MVRACTVRYISTHWDDLKYFVATEERGHYIRNMIRPGTWGDELVLRAFSDLAQRRVNVYSSMGEIISTYGAYGLTISVRFSGGHYDVIVAQ